MRATAAQDSHTRPLIRRQFLVEAGAAVACTALGAGLLTAAEEKPAAKRAQPKLNAWDKPGANGFYLPELPYGYDALEPHIDTETMKIHHDKHHQKYIDNLNAALQGHRSLAGEPLSELLANLDKLPEDVRTPVRNNGGGHANHSLFWKVMGPEKGGQPSGELSQKITADFGSFDAFKEQFSQTAIKQFGSGWSWLSFGKDKLVVEGLPNQDTPISAGRTPILGLDVWEHAYYLKYKNARPDYVAAWWNLVNWDFVGQRFAEAVG